MTMTTREAFERGTDTFNAHDIDGFAEVLADDVVFDAPGGMRGEGKAACAEFFGGWFGAFPDAHVEVHDLHIIGDVAVEEGTFTGTHDGVLHGPAGDIPPTGRAVSAGLHPGAPLPRRQARLVQPDVRPAPDARAARPRSRRRAGAVRGRGSALDVRQGGGDGACQALLAGGVRVERGAEQLEPGAGAVEVPGPRAGQLAAVERGRDVDAGGAGLAGGIQDRDVGALDLAVEVVAFLGRRDAVKRGAVGGGLGSLSGNSLG